MGKNRTLLDTHTHTHIENHHHHLSPYEHKEREYITIIIVGKPVPPDGNQTSLEKEFGQIWCEPEAGTY